MWWWSENFVHGIAAKGNNINDIAVTKRPTLNCHKRRRVPESAWKKSIKCITRRRVETTPAEWGFYAEFGTGIA